MRTAEKLFYLIPWLWFLTLFVIRELCLGWGSECWMYFLKRFSVVATSYTVAWFVTYARRSRCAFNLPAPKTHFAKDISLTSDTPIICTGKHRLMYIKNGIVDERECGMMDVRWKIFHFTYQIPREQQRQLPSCARCFAELICPQKHSGLVVDGSLNKENPTERKHHD